MTPTTAHLSISLDGFVAGPDQSRENPLGVGGMKVHRWHIGLSSPTSALDYDGSAHGIKQHATIRLFMHYG